jgi:hypothetical protein
MWEDCSLYRSDIEDIHAVRLQPKEFKQELLVFVDELKRVSSDAEIMSDCHHNHQELTDNSKQRLLCLSVDVDSPEVELAPYLREGVDLSEVRTSSSGLVRKVLRRTRIVSMEKLKRNLRKLRSIDIVKP